MITINLEERIIDSTKGGEEIYLRLDFKVFVMALSSKKESIGISLNGIESTQETVKNFLDFAKRKLKDNKLQLKVIGPHFLVSKIKSSLGDFPVNSVKFVIRADQFELIYIPKKGVLRASVESKVKVDESVAKIVEQKEIRVVVVDDSKTMCTLLTKILESDPRIKVIGIAERPSQAEVMIEELHPDVITLDIHLPEMTGVELLKKIYPKFQIPTIMITSVGAKEGPLVFDALESGAFDYIQKPELSEIKEVGPLIIEKVKEASQYKISRSKSQKMSNRSVKCDLESLVVIGSSTGGTNALKDILTALPKEIPPILIVQHIPPVFSKAFADRMNSLCPFKVKEAENGDEVLPNQVLVAEGGRQMKVVREGSKLVIELNDDPPVNRFRPSVDYLFESVVPIARKRHVVGVILTGMGKDGADGLLKLRESGAVTIAQDEETSVVYGMPKEAFMIGAAVTVEPLNEIADRIAEYSHRDLKKGQAS